MDHRVYISLQNQYSIFMIKHLLVVNFTRIIDLSHKTYFSRIILNTWKATFCEIKLINDLGLSSFRKDNYFYY